MDPSEIKFKPGAMNIPARWLNWVTERCSMSALIDSSTIRIVETKSGRMPEVVALPVGGGVTGDHPYKVFIREDPENTGSYQAGVYYDSPLRKNLNPENADQAITGLLNEERTEGWLNLQASGTDKLWLKGGFTTWPTLDSAVVEGLGNGDTFDGGVVEHDNASPKEQTYFRRLLATVNCDVTPPVVLEQFVKTDMTVTNLCYGEAMDSSGNNSAMVAAVFPVVL